MKLFTELPVEKIAEYEKLEGAELNAVKVILADEATQMLHGSDCLDAIHTTVESLFSAKRGGSENLDSLVKISIPSDSVTDDVSSSISVVDLLVKAEMASSKGEAKRLIKAGGARVNDEKICDENEVVVRDKFDAEGRLKLSSGKKKHVLITLS